MSDCFLLSSLIIINSLFRNCSFARMFWQLGSLSILSDQNNSIGMTEWFMDYIQFFYEKDGNTSWRIFQFIATLWTIWISRNRFIYLNHDITPITLQQVMQDIIHQQQIFSNRSNQQGNYDHDHQIHPPGFLFANLGKDFIGTPNFTCIIDGSWDNINQLGGFGWIGRNNSHQICHQQGGFMVSLSALKMEAQACLSCLQHFANNESSSSNISLAIYTDSSTLVQMISKQKKTPIDLLWTIDKIQDLGNRLQWCRITKTNRETVEIN